MATSDAPPVVRTSELKRSITVKQLYFYVVGDVLGSGIYVLVGLVAAAVGGAFWMAFLVGVAIAAVTGLAYAELVTKYPQAAGAALYTHKAFGIHFFTFIVCFIVMTSGITSASTASRAFAVNLTVGFGIPDDNVTTLLIALAFIVLIEFAFFLSNTFKLDGGGWLPVAAAVVVFVLMST